MRRHLCLAALSACIMLGNAMAQEEEEFPIDQWVYFDYVEERGWSNSNRAGADITMTDCEAPAGKDYYRLFFHGFLDKYVEDKTNSYWLSAGSEPNMNDVYVYTAGDYFSFLYNVSVNRKNATQEVDLQFCSRPFDSERETCETFSGSGFRDVIADLCPPNGAGTAGRVVKAFYTALEAGDGRAAAANVIPEKRATGPLSASALTGFYGNLRQPLHLAYLAALSANEYQVRYSFETKSGQFCNGMSTVTVKRVGGEPLISGIHADSGC